MAGNPLDNFQVGPIVLASHIGVCQILAGLFHLIAVLAQQVRCNGNANKGLQRTKQRSKRAIVRHTGFLRRSDHQTGCNNAAGHRRHRAKRIVLVKQRTANHIEQASHNPQGNDADDHCLPFFNEAAQFNHGAKVRNQQHGAKGAHDCGDASVGEAICWENAGKEADDVDCAEKQRLYNDPLCLIGNDLANCIEYHEYGDANDRV